MLIIATGWRFYAPPVLPRQALGLLRDVAIARGELFKVAHGAAERGLDEIVRVWVEEQGNPDITDVPYPADWRMGRRAGPIRNAHMWAENWPHTYCCLAFPGPPGQSSGTADCVERARIHHCPVWLTPWGATELTEPPATLLDATPPRSDPWSRHSHESAPTTVPATTSDAPTAPNTGGC